MNIATNSMNRVTNMLLRVDAKLKKIGTEPYRQRKATLAEQKDRVKNLTPQEAELMREQHGIGGMNELLSKFWEEK